MQIFVQKTCLGLSLSSLSPSRCSLSEKIRYSSSISTFLILPFVECFILKAVAFTYGPSRNNLVDKLADGQSSLSFGCCLKISSAVADSKFLLGTLQESWLYCVGAELNSF